MTKTKTYNLVGRLIVMFFISFIIGAFSYQISHGAEQSGAKKAPVETKKAEQKKPELTEKERAAIQHDIDIDMYTFLGMKGRRDDLRKEANRLNGEMLKLLKKIDKQKAILNHTDDAKPADKNAKKKGGGGQRIAETPQADNPK